MRVGAVRLFAVALVGAAAVLAGGCGSGGNNDAAPSASDAATRLAADLKYLGDYMRDWYLWYRRMPAIDIAGERSVDAALDRLRVAEDRYSYIEDAQTYNAFYDDGRALGFGVAYAVVGDSIVVRYVQPNANAAAAGLRRGDRIVAIGDASAAALIASGSVDAAFGPDEEGWRTTLTVERDGSLLSLPMSKSWYALVTVLDARVLVDQGRKIGYISFLAFTQPARSEWTDALSRLIGQGAQDLVVDLRDNGGGLLSVAGTLASTLAPAADAAIAAPWLSLTFNDRHPSADETMRLEPSSPGGSLERLVWITGPRTCSASEALIQGLVPMRSAGRVGETSCGKPVGFTPPQYAGKVYSIVTFRLADSAGNTDWFSGLAPDCQVAETWRGPLGDPGEPKLAAALALLRDGRCPAATKSVTRASADATPPERGMARQTGLR